MNTKQRVILLLSLTIFAEKTIAEQYKCPFSALNQTIDWKRFSKLKTTWYDVLTIPMLLEPMDCWDWSDFVPLEGGEFTTKIHQNLESGNGGEYIIDFHMKPNADGSYTLVEKEGSITEGFVLLKWYFMTDYENYLIVGACGPGFHYQSFAKFRKQRPNFVDVVNTWNRFSALGESPNVALRRKCIKRKHN
uniref:uncharacterized protein LOC120348281 isoform X2 n=1 Tax=Styela clava TaxID=7725 RepID=UPI00193A398E|nr:uncharacterized protein LOC120348281 isoform X2 [Styela clava]